MFKHRANHHHRDLRSARHTREAVKRQQTYRLSGRAEKSEPDTTGLNGAKTTSGIGR